MATRQMVTMRRKILRDECEDLTDDTAVLAVCFNATNLTFVTASGATISKINEIGTGAAKSMRPREVERNIPIISRDGGLWV